MSDTILDHVVKNWLLTERQWANRKGHSTPLLLAHLTESRRRAIDKNLVVATSFVDFRKAFDCVSHSILLHKLKHKFGIEGNLLSWITDYLNHRSKITIVNSTQSMNWTWLAVSLKDRFWVQFCLVCTPMTSQRVWFLAPYTCTLTTREFTVLYWIDMLMKHAVYRTKPSMNLTNGAWPTL